jgi:hypothetical protein
LGVYAKVLNYIHALWGDENSSFFRENMGKRELRAVLVAALCHDIGQYPYSHVLEDTDREPDGSLPANSVYNHETYTKKLLSDAEYRASTLSGRTGGLADFGSLIEKLGITSEDVLSVLTGHSIGELNRGTSTVLNSIIDGPVDADKLDYLSRDSHHAGVNFGSSIDAHRFYQSLTVVNEENDPQILHPQVAITEKGRVPAEEFLIARWHMFTEVYWHRTTRAHEAVLAAAIRRLRVLYAGFDEWFAQVVLDPTTTDEWFLELCVNLTQDNTHLGPLTRDRVTAAPVIEKCKAMLGSLAYSAGRMPYKRLVSISAAHDPGLYKMMQEMRSMERRLNEPFLDELATEIAVRLESVFNIRLDPLDLVIDIPARREPADSVWVVSLDSPRRGAISQLAHHSPMWKEYGASFHDRTRKIRIFCPTSVRELIRSTATRATEELKVYEIVRESVWKISRVAVQLNLFGAKASPTSALRSDWAPS